MGLDAAHIDPHQAIDAVVEVGVDAKVHELDAARFAQLGVLLVEGGDGAAQIAETLLELLEVGAVVEAGKQRWRGGIGAAGGGERQLGGKVLAVEAHQQILGLRWQAAGERHRAKQVAIARIAGQIGTDAEPEIIEPPFAPVGGLDKAAAKLDGKLQPWQQLLFKAEQGVAVETSQPLAGQQLGHRREAVGTYDVESGRIPEDKVVVVIIEGVEIPSFA